MRRSPSLLHPSREWLRSLRLADQTVFEVPLPIRNGRRRQPPRED